MRRSAETVPPTRPTAPPPAPHAVGYAAPSTAQAGRTAWWVWALMVIVVAGLTALLVWRIRSVRASATTSGGGRHGGGGAMHDLPVIVATTRKGDLPVYLYGLGTVTPLETVSLKTRVDGAITEVHFTEGQHVNKGDFLVQIDPRPYQAALDQAKGQLAKDQATLENAEWSVKQDTEAFAMKAISDLQLHTDTANRDAAKGAVEVDKANIEAAQVNLDYCHICSPIDGRAGLRQVDLGNIVHASDTTPLVVITRERPITVVFTLVEDELAQLQKRVYTGVPVQVDAFDKARTTRLARGRLLALDSAIDPTTGTIKIKAQFDNDDHALYPSQFVNARLLVDTIRDAVLIPSNAVQTNANQDPFVYVVQADDTVKMVPVTLGKELTAIGPDESDTRAIMSGLTPGDVVVTTGVDKLVDGTKVAPHAGNEPAGHHGAATQPSDDAHLRRTIEPGAATTQPAGPAQHRRHRQTAD